MDKRFERIILDADDGIIFEFDESQEEKILTIKAVKDLSNSERHVNRLYMNPKIPEGYRYLEGKWDDGFVIERISDGSQFVWVPVGFLDANGTQDEGLHYNLKFGRRLSNPDTVFSKAEFHETVPNKIVKQIEKYEGFYVSKYYVSVNENEKLQAKETKEYSKCDYSDALKNAKTFGDVKGCEYHLLYGAEYDSMIEWLIKTNASVKYRPRGTQKDTGRSRDDRIMNNICFSDFEMTQEAFGKASQCHVIRRFYSEPGGYKIMRAVCAKGTRANYRVAMILM